MEKHCENGILKHEGGVRQVDSERRVLNFVASTSEPDRDAEVVVTAGIDTTAFRRNPVLLVDHNHHAPLGRVVALQVERLGAHDALTGTAEIVPPGTSQMADQAWAEIQSGARNGVSIAFIALDADPPGTPRRVIRRSELLEISSVTQPSCRGCVVIGASGAKALTDQAAFAASFQETCRRWEQFEAKQVAADFQRICERAEKPFAYKFVPKGTRPQIERAAARFASWAAADLGIQAPEAKLFVEARAGDQDFRMECGIVGVNFSSLDTIAVHADLGPEALAETVAHEVAHVAGADEAAADEFAKKFLASTYRQKTGGSGLRAGRPSPGMTYDEKGVPSFGREDETPVIVTHQSF